MKVSYYPGCTLKTKAIDLDIYARRSAEALGIELEEIEEWQCCGGVYPMVNDEIATRLSAVRALMAARDNGGVLVTLCSACHNVLKRTNEDIKKDENFRTKVNNYLKPEVPYTGETKVVHYLEVLRDEIGFDNLKKAVVNPLKGRMIAPYYGCLLLRPGSEMGFDDPENPVIIENFIKALGATAVVYPFRNECCGGYVALDNKAHSQNLVHEITEAAIGAGAQEMITACPLCMYNLNVNNIGDKIPVKYFTQLLCEALGIEG